MNKLNFFKSTVLITAIGILSSCSKKDDTKNNNTEPSKLEIKAYSNLYAPQTGGRGTPVAGAFTKFNFEQNAIVTTDAWDIAFRGSTIIINGGTTIGITDEPARTGNAAVSIVTNTLADVITIPDASTFKQDGANAYAIPTGNGSGWYNYNSATHIISPIAGKIFVIKTHNGKYAKMEITNFYKDSPTNPDTTSLSNYYSFKYVYQPSGTSF